MDASNRTRKHTPILSERRLACQQSPPPTTATSSDELAVTIKILTLEGDGAERIAAHQLAVIVRLLRRAAEAKHEKTAPTSDAATASPAQETS